MIVAEYHSNTSTIRVHDDYCEKETHQLMLHLNCIVSESYKRKQLDGRFGAIAAMKSAEPRSF